MTLKLTKTDLSEQSYDRLFYPLGLAQKVFPIRI